ncbi:MAG: hypothetical protein AAF961_00235 [Planctomycetota bacterium]
MRTNGQDRRTFLRQAAAGTVAGIGDAAVLAKLSPVSAAEAKLDAAAVRLRPEIEPTVRLIEETPRERLLEEVAAHLRKGMSYRQLLAGLMLAGVKNVEPRPSVGHKFHTVLVVNSAHLASLSSPPEHRWLPIFWALDYFKAAAVRDVEERGDWTMSPVDESAVPPVTQTTRAFQHAMDNWDEGAADAAVAGLARTAGAGAVYEMLFRYGMRDFRSIGHKAIYVANSWRTLQCIGWQHAEPVLRSLTYALLNHEGENPSRRDAEPDRPYRRNLELAASVPASWAGGAVDPAATDELLVGLRTASNDEACDQVAALLRRGVAPQSIWDAIHLAAAELLMRQPAIVALHAVTTTNALYFAYQTSGDDLTRKMLLFQNAAFLPMFREAMKGRGAVAAKHIDEIVPRPTEARGPGSIDEIFAQLGEDADAASSKTLAYLADAQDAKPLMDAARLLVFAKGDNAHDYKFSSAALEDYYHVSPTFRPAYLAANMHMLRNSRLADNRLVARTRDALQS